MIAWLSGLVLEKEDNRLVLNVNGVGYEVFISLVTFLSVPSEGESFACCIHTIVREDQITLYGFSQKQERDLFTALIKVSGIGPKVAINILSSISVNEFCQIVNKKEPKALVKLPGIGKKTAERLIIELQDKLNMSTDADIASSELADVGNGLVISQEATQALVALGYPLKQAERIINEIKVDDINSTDELIRQALKKLSPVV